MAKEPRELVDIDVEEISLVDRAANRKKFAIIKRRIADMDELLEILKAVYGDEITEEVAEALRKADLSPEAVNAVKAAFSKLQSYLDEVPTDIKAAIKTLGKYASYGYPAKRGVEKAEDLPLEKVGARLSKVTVEELKKLREIIAAAVGGAAGLKKAEDILKQLLGKATVEKGGDVTDEKNLSPEIQARLAKLDELEAKERQEVRKRDEETLLKPLNDQLKALKDQVEKLEKGSRAVSKGIKGSEEPDVKDGKEVVDLWPSIKLVEAEEGGAE